MTTNITFPCTLPSLGRLYGGKIPDGKVQLLPIRGEQEEQIAALKGAGEAAHEMLHNIVGQLTVLNDFAFQDLIVSDMMAIMFHLFAYSYAPSIDLTPACPKCGKEVKHSQPIDGLVYKTSEGISDDDYKEPFTIKKLPVSGEILKLRLMRVRDLHESLKYKGDYPKAFAHALQIFSINDDINMDHLAKMRWIRNAIGQDLLTMRKAIARVDTGFDVTPTIRCKSCGHEFQVSIPHDFFRQIAA